MSEECHTCVSDEGNPMELNMDFEDLINKWDLSVNEFLAAAGEFGMAYNNAINLSFLCLDCKVHTGAINEYYTVDDEVWKQANPELDGMLCIKCLEGRLGRKLVGADFPIDVPLNDVVRSGEWPGSVRLLEAMNRV